MLSGEEGIRWLPGKKLRGALQTFTDRDLLEWAPPAEAAALRPLRAGVFAVFPPSEAHCPMIALDAHMPIRKVVVTIPVRVLKSL